jgi:hypothetical protein
MAVANVSILRLHRSDKQGQHLLARVSQVGNKSLDLKLIGTDHEHLYHAEVKESSVKSLQANSFSGDLGEWKAILKYALRHEREHDKTQESFEGLETVASISGKTFTITIRKNIGGITQRLGDIKLLQDDEKEEVDAFEWVHTAVATADSMRTELESLQASMDEQRQQVANLSQQLDDLARAKKDHEDELLSKFTALLNAKKLKIRDQQRLLAGAQIDPEAAEAVWDARGGTGRSRKSNQSREAKRKANAGNDTDDEDMNDDAGVDDQDEDEHRQNETPPRSEDEATEDEEDLDGPAPGRVSSNTRSNMDVDEPEELPPRRDLPFARKDSKPAAPTNGGGDDDDETDDEL